MRRLLLAAALMAAALASAQAQTLRIALREDADLLDPTLARTYVGRIVFAGLCDKLFDIDEKLQIVPQLATGYEWSDPQTLLIHLRPRVVFQDGEDLDAAAVKYSLDRHLTMQGSFRRGEVSAIDHVDVVDPGTVRVALKSPSGAFLAQLTDRAGMIVAPKVAEQEGKDFGLHPVCAGPFRFVERVPQDHVTLERFPQYWDGKDIHFDKVIYRVIVDSSARLANLKAGAVDLAEYVVPTDAAAVKADPKLHLVVSDSLGYFAITNNLANGRAADNPYGRDARVRQAFSLAIDRAALVNVVFNDMNVPTMQAVPTSSPFHDAALKVPARDLAKAKTLLAEAGVKPPVPLELMVANNPDTQQAAEVIQSMASEAGFDVHIRATEFATTLTLSEQGEYQALMIGWSGRVDIDGNTYAFLHSKQAQNVGAYASPTVDRLLDEARGMTDVAQRRALYAQMWTQEEKDLPITYLWTPRNIVGMSADLHGFRPVPDGMIRVQGLEMGKVVRGHLGTRIAQIIPTLLLVSVLVFCLQQLMPGDPALVMAGEERGDPQVLAQIRAELWLDRPLPVQYVHWLGNVVQGNLGFSWRIRQPVSQLILQKLPVTLQLASMAFVIAVLIGVPAGIIAAVERNRFWDYVANAIGLAGLSTPTFWLGIMLILLVSVDLGWLPPSGYVPLTVDWRASLATTIMPAFVLGNSIAAILMRHTRSAMLTALDQDFVRTARAKGLREFVVVVRHALRNALIPVVTLGALELGTLLSGAVLTEQVFSIPGFGKLIVDAVFNRDYPVVQGVVLVTAALYVLLNLAADVLYVVINPRLRGA